MARPSPIFDVMAALPLDVSAAEAEAVAQERWGVEAVARVLPGERDRNFHLRDRAGREFVLKFANPAEDAGFRAMQIAALRHIERVDPGLDVPRMVALPGGGFETAVRHRSGAVQQARLLSWLQGVPIGEAAPGRAQREAYGAALARLQDALASFRDPAAAGHEMAWDLQHAPKLAGIAFAVRHEGARRALGALLDWFARDVVPVVAGLPRQIVHNDLNRMNVLVDPADHARIAGIIDFGDFAVTAVLYDVAIAAVQLPVGDVGLAEGLGDFLLGYGAGRLGREAVALLPGLMALRLALGMTLASWHRHTQPDNPHFDVSDAVFERRLGVIAGLQEPGLVAAVLEGYGRDGGGV